MSYDYLCKGTKRKIDDSSSWLECLNKKPSIEILEICIVFFLTPLPRLCLLIFVRDAFMIGR